MATFETEIRKLQPVELCTLGQILDQSGAWKKLMASVPKDDNLNDHLFNNEHFTMIEQAVRQQQRSAADIFLSEWSTMGRNRPTCRILLDLLVKAELFRAADYLAVEVLKTNPPERPKVGPAAPIDVSEKVLEELLKQQVAGLKMNEESMAWSLNFVEKPIKVIADHHGIKNPKGSNNHSDLMKFNSDKSDMMKFGEIPKDPVESLPKEISDLMKFSAAKAANNAKISNYELEAAPSEDIPLCVKENRFQPNKILTSPTTTQMSRTESSIGSSEDYSESQITDEQDVMQEISENNIPVGVLKFERIDSNKTDT